MKPNDYHKLSEASDHWLNESIKHIFTTFNIDLGFATNGGYYCSFEIKKSIFRIINFI